MAEALQERIAVGEGEGRRGKRQSSGWVNGESPLTSTTYSTQNGEVWSFYIRNPIGPEVTVEYQITFTPD